MGTPAAGIPLDALDFYEELAVENSRAWWQANKPRWEASVRDPMAALVDALADEFGEAHLFRPNRDVRFSADKSPYKDHQGAIVAVHPGVGYYVQVSAAGLLVGGGFYPTGPDQTRRYREAVDRPEPGAALVAITDRLVADGFTLGGEQVKTRPRGVPTDHPRLELIRYANLTAGRDHGAPSWLPTAEAVEHVRADWRGVRPLVEWVAEHIGPSEESRRR